jgi:hypothetical protein
MTNPAVYGLIGAVGGALIGSGTTFALSTLAYRRSRRDLHTDDETRKSEERVARLMLLRVTGRAWQDSLERVFRQFELGMKIDLDRFDDAIKVHSRETMEAAHAAVGRPAKSSGNFHPFEPMPSMLPPLEHSSDTRIRLLMGLRETTRMLRELILTQTEGPVGPGDQQLSLCGQALRHVRQLRLEFESFLMEQVNTS